MSSKQYAGISQEAYLAYLGDRKLMGSRCTFCGRISLPPRRICPSCHSTGAEWVDLTGQEGTLSTYTCVHVAPPRFVARGFSNTNPYAFGIVKLDAGASIAGFLVGVDATEPASIVIGARMRATFVEHETSQGTIQVDLGFEPVE